MAAKPEDDPRLGCWIEPPGVINSIDKAIERLSAREKDIREKLTALQANFGAIAAAAWR